MLIATRCTFVGPNARTLPKYLVFTTGTTTIWIYVGPAHPASRQLRRADRGSGRKPWARFPLHRPALLRHGTCLKRMVHSYSKIIQFNIIIYASPPVGAT